MIAPIRIRITSKAWPADVLPMRPISKVARGHRLRWAAAGNRVYPVNPCQTEQVQNRGNVPTEPAATYTLGPTLTSVRLRRTSRIRLNQADIRNAVPVS